MLFRICAVNRIGEGEWSPESHSATLLSTTPAAPIPPEVLRIGSHDIDIKWLPPDERGAPIMNMRIDYKYVLIEYLSLNLNSVL